MSKTEKLEIVVFEPVEEAKFRTNLVDQAMAFPKTDMERALVSEVKRLSAWIEKLGNDAPLVRVTETEKEIKNLVQVAHFARLYFTPFGSGREFFNAIKRIDDALIPYKGVLDELIEARREAKVAVESGRWPSKK